MYTCMCLSEKKGEKINLIIRCLSSFYEIKMLHVHCVFTCVYQRKMKKIIIIDTHKRRSTFDTLEKLKWATISLLFSS